MAGLEGLTSGLGNGEVMLTAVFVAYETQFGFSQFLPSIMTIGTFVDSPDKVHMIREGEVIASVFALTFATVFSLLTKSPAPLALSVVAIAMTLAVYEYALRKAPAWNA